MIFRPLSFSSYLCELHAKSHKLSAGDSSNSRLSEFTKPAQVSFPMSDHTNYCLCDTLNPPVYGLKFPVSPQFLTCRLTAFYSRPTGKFSLFQ